MGERRTAIVTGATAGLGQAAAVALARAGFHVVVVGRNAARGRETLTQIEKHDGTGELELADFFSMKEVASLGARLAAKHARIELLVNNAGGTFSETQRTVDGLERTFALNVASAFVLTEALRPSLARARGRVVNLVTHIPRLARASLAQLEGAKASAGIASYVRSKLALLAVTIEQQARYGADGTSYVALHPGVITGTRFGGEMPDLVRRWGATALRALRVHTDLDEAVSFYVRVSTGPVEGGGYYYRGVLRAPPRYATRVELREPLWSALERIRLASGPQ